MKQHYDILLVGAGLFNATLSYHFVKSGKSVLVIDKRKHIAGNCYDEPSYGGDMVHRIPELMCSIPPTKRFGIL